MDNIDFEALGRYTHAVERAAQVGAEMSAKLACLGRDMDQHVKRGVLSSTDVVRHRIDTINALFAQLVELRKTADEMAPRCGKPSFQPQAD